MGGGGTFHSWGTDPLFLEQIIVQEEWATQLCNWWFSIMSDWADVHVMCIVKEFTVQEQLALLPQVMTPPPPPI